MKFTKKQNNLLSCLTIVLILLAGFFSINAQPVEGDDKTLSPYFFVNSDDPATDRLPLKHTSADVNISGVIADVVVQQVYVNEGENALEAIYVFPASTRAAVYSMKMTIGDRQLTAEIQEKQQARQAYEAAKQEGKTASLLEQHRPNVFQMNVANILPGDSISVELRYTELLAPEDGTYEFVYPTVVGPRYSNQPAATASAGAGDLWILNPYFHAGKLPTYSFDLTASIRAGMPVQRAKCLSHKVNINFDGPQTAIVHLDPNEVNGGNRDFILQYQLRGEQIQSGVLLLEGEKEHFFLAMVQPPERVVPQQFPGREYIFIVDVSGSMNGFPLDISKALLKDLIGKLTARDRFNVLLFAGGNSLMSNTSLPATKANINQAFHLIDRQRGGGGTQLLPALQRALALPEQEGFSRSIVIATDGYVSVEKAAFDLIRNKLGDANFFTFGIGSSVNRYIIEGMARIGRGTPFVLTDPQEAPAQADRFRTYIQSPVLTDIAVNYGDFRVYDVEPFAIPDVLAGRPILIYGKYKGRPQGKITIHGTTGEGSYRATLDLAKADRSEANSALRYLWARKRIQMLDDYQRLGSSPEVTQEVTQLGLDYNLLTAYTSFVAIDSLIRNEGGQLASVKQPLPLPQGVSNLAVGGNAMQSAQGQSGGGPRGPSRSKAGGLGGLFGSSPKDASAAPEAVSLRDVEDETLELEEETSGKEAIFTQVEQMPAFPGGEKQLQAWLKQHLQYPEKAKKQGISGTVYVRFVVDEKGRLTEVQIVRGVSPELDAEALRIVKAMPRWQAGAQRGQPVKVRLTLPVRFALDN